MEFTLFKRKKVEERSVPDVQSSYYGDGLTFSQIYNQATPMSLAAVARCVDLISDSIAMLPFKVKATTDGGKEVVKEHPLNLIFQNKTDNVMTMTEMIRMCVQNVLMKGNGYLYIERSNGIVKRLRYLEASDVQIVWNKYKYELKYQCPVLGAQYIDPKDMIHFKIHSWDGINGISVLSYASRSILIAQQTENTARNYFSNGTLLSGVLTYQGNLRDDQKKQIRESWQSTYGINGNGGVAVLGGGMTYQQISSNASDSQMLESRLYNVQDICRFFGVNPVLVGELSHTAYSTIEAVQQDFLVHTLQPIITMMEQEMSRKLFNEGENFEVNIDESYVLRTDKAALATYYNTMVSNGIMSRNEIRNELGFNTVEGGDKLTVSYSDVAQNEINNENKNEMTDEESN